MTSNSTSLQERIERFERARRELTYASVAAGLSSATAHLGSPSEPQSIATRGGNSNTSRDAHASTAARMPAMTSTAPERRPGSGGGPAVGSATPWTSDHSRYTAERTAYHPHDDRATVFTPSYLRNSRYMQRLQQAHEEHVAEWQDAVNRGHAMKPALSASSSNANLHKLAPTQTYRGVTHDVVERQPPQSVEEERLCPLPSRWSEEDKMNGLEIMADGTEVRFNGVTKTSDEAAAVRSDHPIPKEVGIYYFEVMILSRGKDGLIGIGFSGKKANLNRLPGWETDSWAYHGDDGYVFACTASGKAYGPRFASQDVIGCGIDFRSGSAFFTKNGNYLGNAFSGIKGDRLFPSVGMKKPGEHLRINFGRLPFLFDIDSMMEHVRSKTLAEINKADVSSLHPPDDENALIHNLIGQYLAHEGYVETARAFTSDIHARQQSLSNGKTPPQRSSEDDDIHALNRQKIRRSILNGDIDRALKYTYTYYPRLFEQDRNKDIYFRLRCRKFIEMMRRYTELGTATSSPTTVTKSVDSLGSNGRADAEDDLDAEESADTQMELDDQLHRETSKGHEPPSTADVDMDGSQELSPKLSYMKADQLLSLVVRYGQDLQQEFGRDPRPFIQKQLQDIFAIMAYQNLDVSPVSHLFDPQGRAEIAEEVNGAILVSLGKPSSAALEKLCAQTDALLVEASSYTPHVSLINVRTDFLRG